MDQIEANLDILLSKYDGLPWAVYIYADLQVGLLVEPHFWMLFPDRVDHDEVALASHELLDTWLQGWCEAFSPTILLDELAFFTEQEDGESSRVVARGVPLETVGLQSITLLLDRYGTCFFRKINVPFEIKSEKGRLCRAKHLIHLKTIWHSCMRSCIVIVLSRDCASLEMVHVVGV